MARKPKNQPMTMSFLTSGNWAGLEAKKKELPTPEPDDLIRFPLEPENSAVDSFAYGLIEIFTNGLPVKHPSGKSWYATLKAISPQENEVAAMTRLSSARPDSRIAPELRVDVFEEEPSKTLFDKSKKKDDSTDLLLAYSFLLALPIETNVAAYLEFATNEISRLRRDVVD